ncbi:MAG: hypothetical protein Q8O32_02915 [bacterium]|nr:hypothetical protein [bacterium]
MVTRIVVQEPVSCIQSNVPPWVQEALVACSFFTVDISQTRNSLIFDPFTRKLIDPQDETGFFVPACRARLSLYYSSRDAALWFATHFPDDSFLFFPADFCRLLTREELCLAEI